MKMSFRHGRHPLEAEVHFQLIQNKLLIVNHPMTGNATASRDTCTMEHDARRLWGDFLREAGSIYDPWLQHSHLTFARLWCNGEANSGINQGLGLWNAEMSSAQSVTPRKVVKSGVDDNRSLQQRRGNSTIIARWPKWPWKEFRPIFAPSPVLLQCSASRRDPSTRAVAQKIYTAIQSKRSRNGILDNGERLPRADGAFHLPR